MKITMKNILATFTTLAVAGLMVTSTARIAVAADSAGITEDNVIEKVGAASTKADHEALASYFRAEAKEKAAEVAKHEAMIKSWSKDGGKPKEHMKSHCQALLSAYGQEEKALEALAKEQEKLAK